MAMDKINGSHLPRTGGLEQFLGTQRGEKDGKAAERADSASPARQPKPADTMEISETAHRLVDLRHAVDTGREAIEALPEIRADKVEQARKRMEQGFYNSQAVRDEIAGKLDGVLRSMDEL